MSREDRVHVLGLLLHFGFGSPVPGRLLARYPDPAEIWDETPFSLSFRTGLNESRTGFLSRRTTLLKQAAVLLERSEGADTGVLLYTDTAYPPLLRHIHAPPPALFYRGDPAVLSGDCLGIVGTRHASAAGRYRAGVIASGAARAGRVVVSGAARGIDGAAHHGALAVPGGLTAAVLGCGTDVPYPRLHAALFTRIVDRGGVLASEFPPGTEPRRAYFPMRNRIVSGLCRSVVVIEAPERSGALITAQTALEQGRDVFACRWTREAPHNAGTRRLLEEGAREYREDSSPVGDVCTDDSPVLRALAGGPLSLNEILRRTRLRPEDLLPDLTRLELDNRIAARNGAFWLRTG